MLIGELGSMPSVLGAPADDLDSAVMCYQGLMG